MVMGSADTALASLMQTYYDKVFLEHLTPDLRYDQIAVQKTIPERSGKTVYWNRLRAMAAGYTLTEGTAPGFSAYSAAYTSATLTQLGQVVSISDLFSMTELSDAVKDAVTLLGEGAAKDMDSYIRDTIGFSFGTGDCSTNVVDAASATCPSVVTNYFPMLTNSTLAWSRQALIASMGSACATIDRVRQCATHLRKMDCKPMADGYYVGVIHPVVADRLMQDTYWASWNQYTNPESMYKGEIGRIHNVRFVSSTNAAYCTVKASGWGHGTGSYGGKVFGTIIVGRGAFAVAKMQGGPKVYIVPNEKPDKSDPLCQYGTVGYKITFAAQVLNPSCGIIMNDYLNSTEY